MQPEQITTNFPHKNAIFLADSVSGNWRVMETKDLFLPLSGATMISNAQANTASAVYDISHYNQVAVFIETTGSAANPYLSGLVQTQAPTNNWVDLDSRGYTAPGNTILYFEGPYNNLRTVVTGFASGSLWASFYGRRV